MTTMPCGCCTNGGDYVRRHLDPENHLPTDVKASVLAGLYLEMFDAFVPEHVPDKHTLAKWILDAQVQKRMSALA